MFRSATACSACQVRSGEALAAVIIPPDFTTKLSTGGFSSAEVEVVYNGDALKQSFVRSTISSNEAPARSVCMPKKYELKIGVKRSWLTTTFDH